MKQYEKIRATVSSRRQWALRSAAHHSTMWLGSRYGATFPMHFVSGYPRSGTSWFSEMLGDYLNLPRPKLYVLPIGFASVIHTHYEANRRLNDCFYVVRDGRDVMVSHYFYVLKQFAGTGRLEKIFGRKINPDNTAENLPLFIKASFTQKPVGTRQHWGKHVSQWHAKSLRASPHEIVFVKYEELLTTPKQTLMRILQQKYGTVNEELVDGSIARHDYSTQSRRSAKQHTTVMRKGIIGDWRNHFTPECAHIFNQYAGYTLMSMGYERDFSWANELK